ncbi:F-box protein At4g00755-like isoform X3 [Panicum hallii]|uniref:F-box protein At4g00755-like isoform X3 n=1 Tax=Panicum hallii TaxID=206008 RepID=UPI000DF4D3F5|nr:F-box protein At4g00755-like isoform X3 [Panicum hallii]
MGMGMGEEEEEDRADFLQWLGPDTSAIVFTLLHHPADLARASAVSRSWRTFVIANQFSKIQCLRVCPEVSNFTSIEASSSGSDVKEDVGSSAAAGWENQKRDHRVYMHLSHSLLSHYNSRNCIIRCIGASSTDNFPEETIENTLEPIDHVEMSLSYWSSGGQRDPSFPECLIYMLHSDLCLIDEIKIQPFQAFFQYGSPIYSAQYVRFRMGYPKLPLCPEQLVSDENEGQLTADDNYTWTYASPEFPMLQENVAQSFKLPHAVVCIGGVVKIELLGRIQKQAIDGLYYCVPCPNIGESAVAGAIGGSSREWCSPQVPPRTSKKHCALL